MAVHAGDPRSNANKIPTWAVSSSGVVEHPYAGGLFILMWGFTTRYDINIYDFMYRIVITVIFSEVISYRIDFDLFGIIVMKLGMSWFYAFINKVVNDCFLLR